MFFQKNIVGYLRHMKGEKLSKNAEAIIKGIINLIKSLFTQFRDDEEQSLRHCFSADKCFLYLTKNSQGKTKKIIAAI